ncbi:hypothetical protein [Aquabacterium sp.]|uniref:hypothetical protein n=1 Tax=Aquabacterium sp. TaxID=1872578 RepID=UPI003784BD33
MGILSRFVTIIITTTALVSCGGGQSADTPAQPRRQALAAVQLLYQPAQLFSYAERAYPTLFPAGPANQTIDSGGQRYTVRYYASTGNYLGIGEGDGVVYGLGPFTGGTLTSLGAANDYYCQATDQACAYGRVGAASAWDAARVDFRCAKGTVTSGTTDAAGRYTKFFAADALPCLVRATATDGQVLYSVIASVVGAFGGSYNVHITPMTSLAVAYLAGGAPSAFYEGFSAAQADRLAPAAVAAAATSVVSTLRTAGLDFTPGGDIFNGILSHGANGSAQGKLLVQLAAKLSGSLTQATLEDAIARTTAAAKAAGTPSLPPELLLAPAAPNCSALRSGKYLFATSDVANPLLTLTLDATALKLVEPNLALTAAGKCHYQQGGLELAVSDAGVLLGTVPIGSATRAVIGMPAQTLGLADLAGRWNALSTGLDPQAAAAGYLHSATSTYDASGRLTELTYCGKDAGKLAADCISGTGTQIPDIRLSVDAGGGFLVTNRGDGSTGRLAAYRSGSGELMMVLGGRLAFSTLARRSELPELGRVQEFWQLTVSTADTAAAQMTQTRHTVVATDATTGTFRRDSLISPTGATRPERLEINRYREGYTHRIPETVTGSDGSSQAVSEFLSLPMRGAGLNPVAVLGTPQTLSLSLLKSTAP